MTRCTSSTIWDVSLPRMFTSSLPVIGAGMLAINYCATLASDAMYRKVVLKENISAEALIESPIKQTRKVILYSLCGGLSAALSFIFKTHLLALGLFSLPLFTVVTMFQLAFSAAPLAIVCFCLSRDLNYARQVFS